jgi:hypothetical protein
LEGTRKESTLALAPSEIRRLMPLDEGKIASRDGDFASTDRSAEQGPPSLVAEDCKRSIAIGKRSRDPRGIRGSRKIRIARSRSSSRTISLGRTHRDRTSSRWRTLAIGTRAVPGSVRRPQRRKPFRYEVAYCREKVSTRTDLHGGQQAIHAALEFLGVGFVRSHDSNLVDSARLSLLHLRHQLFVQLLARATTGEHHGDITMGLQPGKANHILGEIDDANGIAHLKHADSPTGRSESDCLEHELQRFENSHEVARDIPMRHRQGATGGHLSLEERHHAPFGAEHVAEADDAEAAPAAPQVGPAKDEAFRDPFAGPRSHSMVDRLVGGDQDQLAGFESGGRFPTGPSG